ncbi:MAG: PKD domain-containing protein, partial [Myxococcales bacterium]
MSVRQHAIGRLALAVSLVGMVACGGEETTQPVLKGGAGGDVPYVRIEAHPAQGPAPLTVAFSAAVTGAKGDKTVAWDFADTKTGSGLQVTHEFAEPGIYQVRATATDAEGDAGSDVVTVVVWSNKKPEAWIHADVTGGEAPLRVSFQAIAGGGDGTLSYAWELGDGAKSNVANPVHVYEAAGEFTASLKVTDENGDEASAEVQIVVVPAEPQTALSVVAKIVSGACGLPNRTEVLLDASATVHPAGEPLFFDWVVARSPAESDGGYFSNREAPITFFYPDAAGDFEIRLFVRDLENVYASGPLRLVADDTPALVTIVGGDNQTARAGEVFELPLLVNVTNRCGLALPGVRVNWYGTNAAGESLFSETDPMGGAWNSVRAGGRVGEAKVRAVAARQRGKAEASFSLEVVAGTPALVLMDAVSDVEISETQGTTLTFRVTDAYGNPLTDHEADIDLTTVGSPVPATFEAFGNGLTYTTISTTGGVATVQLFNGGVAGLARVDIVYATLKSTGRMLSGGSWRKLARLDFESGDLDWRRVGDWEIGAPTSGPNAAHSGTGVLATNLAGDFEHQPIPVLPHMASTIIPVPGGDYGQYIRVRFN